LRLRGHCQAGLLIIVPLWEWSSIRTRCQHSHTGDSFTLPCFAELASIDCCTGQHVQYSTIRFGNVHVYVSVPANLPIVHWWLSQFNGHRCHVPKCATFYTWSIVCPTLGYLTTGTGDLLRETGRLLGKEKPWRARRHGGEKMLSL